jgi:LacI family transcriptional regulator
MSSVAINFERAGYEAALLLFRLLRGKRRVPLKITVPATHVVARSSTDIIAVSDPHVNKAVQFIRNHARENLMVANVSLAAALSRRTLEKRFRQELRCSIQEHIRNVRTDRIARLLVETNLPVGRIAEDMGFPDVQHFARYFRSRKQMSPLTYRKTQGRHTA